MLWLFLFQVKFSEKKTIRLSWNFRKSNEEHAVFSPFFLPIFRGKICPNNFIKLKKKNSRKFFNFSITNSQNKTILKSLFLFFWVLKNFTHFDLPNMKPKIKIFPNNFIKPKNKKSTSQKKFLFLSKSIIFT
jgi:hypothetical protein